MRNLPELAIFGKQRESGQSRIEHRPGLAIPPKRRSDTEREYGRTRIGERGGFHGGMGFSDFLIREDVNFFRLLQKCMS